MSLEAPTGRPEKTQLRLGFIALADCAPLVAARELGFFADEGLDVVLERQGSWAAIRDRVVLGRLDGAQMLAGLPLATTLGLGTAPQPMVTALSLGLNGNAITLDSALWSRMQALAPELAEQPGQPASAAALRRVWQADRAEGLAPLTFAVVHPVSSHNYQLRYWLASAGIDPDRDVRIIVVPPARMLANLRAGRIAGCCVGAPWNELAAAEGIGHIALTGHELWHNAPEKVLGVTRAWATAHPVSHRALIRALIRACRWLDEPANRARIARLVAAGEYVDCDPEQLAAVYAGQLRREAGGAIESHPDHLVFARYQANFPWRSHAIWFMRQMQRWEQLHPATDIHAVADQVYRPGLYREVAHSLDLAVPAADHKPEGRHAVPWVQSHQGESVWLGPDLFFDLGRFDPAAYVPPISETHSSLSNVDQGDNP